MVPGDRLLHETPRLGSGVMMRMRMTMRRAHGRRLRAVARIGLDLADGGEGEEAPRQHGSYNTADE